MLNFLALMSFSMPDGRDEFTLEEFVQAFELERISLGGPVFDLEKLTWLNGRYLRRLTTDEFIARLRGGPLSDSYLAEVLPLVRERVDTLEGFFEYAVLLPTSSEVAYDAEALRHGASGVRIRRPEVRCELLEQPGRRASNVEACRGADRGGAEGFRRAPGLDAKSLRHDRARGRHWPQRHAAAPRTGGPRGRGAPLPAGARPAEPRPRP